MNLETAIELFRQMIWTSFILIGPLLGTAMFVGLVVSLIQTVTSIQEQTLVFVPKLIAAGLTLIIISQWMVRSILEFSTQLLQRIAEMGP